jgi:hypothetical protein
MKYLKLFEKFQDVEIDKKTIEDYPNSVKSIYNRFNQKQQKSINDNLEKFAKIAKKLFYSSKNWKNYFQKNKLQIQKLNNLTEITNSIEKWMNKKPTK